MYKQYQQQNEEEYEEQENEEDNLEAEEKKKNLIVYGMMAVLGLFVLFLLAKTIYNKESTSVIYKNGGNSERVIKTGVQQSGETASDEQGIEEYIDVDTLDAADLHDTDENISDTRDLYEIAVENGFVGTREEFYELLSNWNYSTDELEKNLEKLQELIKQMESSGADGESGENGEDGKDGKDGRDGRDGRDGANGKDGKDGSDGKTTFLAYADDLSGTGFSLTPMETSKYVGTCITSESTQPRSYAAYSNWQIFRTYIITTTTDEYGVTTMHIN